MTESWPERRSGSVESEESDAYSPSPGIQRVLNKLQQAMREHNEECAKLDPSQWFTPYDVLNHHIKVRNVHVAMGKARGEADRLLTLREISALGHDSGKLKEECKIYRLNRKLTPEEKIILAKHAAYSGQFIGNCMREVREIDRSLLMQVLPIVSFHHQPWKISDPFLRQIGYDLKFADIFVAVQEDRDRPGLGLSEAIDFIEQLDICERDPQNSYHLPMIYESKRIICWLYGLNLKPDD